MRIRVHSGTVIGSALLVLGVVICLSGCASTGMQRSERTGASMKAVERDLNQAIAQVDATKAALEDLIRPGQADVKKAFKQFSASVDKMETLGERLFDHADKMSAQGKDYFEEWRKEGNTYKNPEIRALSEQRRADLSAIFAKVPEASVGVKGAFTAYMSDIREIHTYLSNDLTPKGVETITPIAQKAVRDGDSLRDAVSPVLYAIGNARAAFAHGGAE
ncbi:DUF2959 family protein [Candidatus Fermentibacteria bacterium]|nr:DUF2959 family protein [Candidatus Fermentibacteria bacterium]